MFRLRTSFDTPPAVCKIKVYLGLCRHNECPYTVRIKTWVYTWVCGSRASRVQAVLLSPVYAQLVVRTDIYYVHTAYFWIRLYSRSAGSGSDWVQMQLWSKQHSIARQCLCLQRTNAQTCTLTDFCGLWMCVLAELFCAKETLHQTDIVQFLSVTYNVVTHYTYYNRLNDYCVHNAHYTAHI